MKVPSFYLLLFVFFLHHSAVAQQDDVSPHFNLSFKTTELDSLEKRMLQLPDSLLPAYHKIDSIRNDFNVAADSIHSQYKNSVSAIDAQTRKLSNRIDSLGRLKIPATRYTQKLDSLGKLRETIAAKFTAKLEALKAKTSDKLLALDVPPEYKAPLQEFTRKVGDLNLDSSIPKIPELNIPGYSLSKVDGIGDLADKVNGIGDIGNPANMSKLDTPLGKIGDVARQGQGYQDDLKNITQGNLDEVQKLPETIEEQASRIDGMDELRKQSGVLDEHRADLDALRDPDKAKEKAVVMAKKAATDHFAGKQEQLKSAMEKISKYKQKYSSVSSIKDLPKRPPNPMKGKPFVERLVPGLYLQYQRKNFYLLDVNPYLGYKLSGRLTSGLGWNHRYSYDRDSRSFTSRSRIFGPRGYIDFKLGKGFIAHAEGETMNTFVPSTLRGNPDTGHREWVWSFMTGLKKEYRIYKNLKGTALIQYNLFNRYYKAPYVDRLNSRIGLEYVLKAGKRNSKKKKE